MHSPILRIVVVPFVSWLCVTVHIRVLWPALAPEADTQPAHGLGEEPDDLVGPRAEDPGLRRMEARVHHADVVHGFVCLQDLDGYDQRVRHQVVVYRAVQNVHVSVIGARRKQRIVWMKCHLPNSPFVIFECFVRLISQVKIVPGQPSVVGSHDEVVSRRV